MSLSWNRLIHIQLFADGATLEWRRRWPRRVMAREALAFAQPDLAPAMAAVTAALDARGWTGPVRLVLGNRWLRFASLPWALQSGNDATDGLTAAGWLAQADSDAAAPGAGSAWQVHWDAAYFGMERFFVAANADTGSSLGLLDTTAHPLQQWRPWAMEAWNACRHQLPTASGALCVPEAGSLALIHYEEGRVTRLQQRAFPTHDLNSLVSLLRLEELRQAQPLLICATALPAPWQQALSALGTLLPTGAAIPPPPPRGEPSLEKGDRLKPARRHALALAACMPASPRRRWLPLLLMSVLASAALLQVREIVTLEGQRQEQQGRLEEQAFLLERRQAHAANAMEAPLSPALASIQQQLTIPWQRLFNGLDQAASPAVSLLAFSPDAANRQLRLTIEAATLESALAYVDRLSRQPALLNAHLVSQRPTTAMASPPSFANTNEDLADTARLEVVAQWRQP